MCDGHGLEDRERTLWRPAGRKARSAGFLFLSEDFESSDALQSRSSRFMSDFVVSEVFSFSPIAQKEKSSGGDG
jgi:hypothetical protein